MTWKAVTPKAQVGAAMNGQSRILLKTFSALCGPAAGSHTDERLTVTRTRLDDRNRPSQVTDRSERHRTPVRASTDQQAEAVSDSGSKAGAASGADVWPDAVSLTVHNALTSA